MQGCGYRLAGAREWKRNGCSDSRNTLTSLWPVCPPGRWHVSHAALPHFTFDQDLATGLAADTVKLDTRSLGHERSASRSIAARFHRNFLSFKSHLTKPRRCRGARGFRRRHYRFRGGRHWPELSGFVGGGVHQRRPGGTAGNSECRKNEKQYLQSESFLNRVV